MNDERVKLVLASASPRRLALLDQAGITPDLLSPVDLDETPKKREAARAIVQRLAVAKARTAQSSPQVRQLGGNLFILAADTAVSVGRRLLPKAETPEDAADCLWLLSGRSHRVYTAVCHLNGSFSNVVGLPLCETINLLQGSGYPVYYSWMNYQPS